MIRPVWLTLAVAVALTACGGNNGDPAPAAVTPVSAVAPVNPVTPVTPVAPVTPVTTAAALTFSPPTASAAFEAGTSTAVSVAAIVTKPDDFSNATFFLAQIVDDSGVILPNAKIVQSSAQQYTAILQTSPTLPEGKYSGKFTVRLCKDAACTAQFPGSPLQLPYEFQVAGVKTALLGVASSIPLAVTANVGIKVTAEPTVTVSGGGASWTAASDASWVKLSSNAGSGNGAFVVRYDSSGLNDGNYNATVTVVSSDGQRVALPVALQMLPNMFQLNASGISFNAINGAPIAAQAVKLAFNSGALNNWTASSNASWLGVSPESGSAPGQTALSINPAAAALASGAYSANLTLGSPGAISRIVPVVLNLTTPTLSMSANSLMLGGTYGRDSAPQTLSMSLNTQTNTWPWSMAALPAGVSASAVSGKLGETATKVTYTLDAAAVAVGTTSSVVQTSVKVNGDTLSAPLTLTINKDQQKILASSTAVALVSTPSWSRLSRTLTIGDNFGPASAWSASSSQPWLTLVSSDNKLTLTANPATLPQNTISYATVTLSTSAAGVTAPEPVRIAIWKGSSSPLSTIRLAASYTSLLADPIRPLVYAHNGGASIDVYNVYTATKVASIAAVGAALGDMTASPNGDRLYVYDTANRALVRVNLTSLSKEGTWALAAAVGKTSRLKAIRPNGVEVILMSAGDAIAAATGTSLGRTGIVGDVTATDDGKAVYAQDEAASPASLMAFNVDYSEMGGGTLYAARTDKGVIDVNAADGTDIAVSADGSRLYRAAASLYRCGALSPANLSVIGDLPGGGFYPSNVEVGSDGRVYCGIASTSSAADFWVHGADGILLKSYKVAGSLHSLLARQMVVSADGMIVAVLSDDPLLAIVPVGP